MSLEVWVQVLVKGFPKDGYMGLYRGYIRDNGKENGNYRDYRASMRPAL